MQILFWNDSIDILDSLFLFFPLSFDLTEDVCLRFWNCVSKNISKESISSFIKETSISKFGQRGVLHGKKTMSVVLTVFELLSVDSSKDFDKKETTSSFEGSPYNSSLVLKCFRSFLKGAIEYATIINNVFWRMYKFWLYLGFLICPVSHILI